MTTQEKIEAIRLVCIVANPEIVELKFGCMLDFGDGLEIFVKEIGDGSYLTNLGRYHGQITRSQIIGRPIHLADILLAMNGNEKALDYGLVPSWNCDYVRFVFQDENAGSFMGDEPVWWLKKSFEDQDEQTIDFIHGLLCK